MNNKAKYISVNIIQSFGPGCLNRDDTNSPKTCFYGGVTRARISSQCIKHAEREDFRERWGGDTVAIRTKTPMKLLAKDIMETDPSVSEEKALAYAKKAFAAIGIDTKEEKKEVLYMTSKAQSHAVAEVILNNLEAFKGKTVEQEVKDMLIDSVIKNPSPEELLFGKMVAGNPLLNVDACVAVSQAISVHEVENEFDFFTALDDMKTDGESGAAHMGFSEFNSAIYHRCMALNVKKLSNSTSEDIIPYVSEAIKGFIGASPSAKFNSFASVSYPYTVFVTVTEDKPVNCDEAFLVPLPKDVSLDEACKKMYDWANEYFYGEGSLAQKPVRRWMTGNYKSEDLQTTGYAKLLEELEELLRE